MRQLTSDGLILRGLTVWVINFVHVSLSEYRQMLQEAKLELKKSKRKDYYKILGIPKGATEEAIKKAYKKEALKHHPGEKTGWSNSNNAHYVEYNDTKLQGTLGIFSPNLFYFFFFVIAGFEQVIACQAGATWVIALPVFFQTPAMMPSKQLIIRTLLKPVV